MYSMGKGHPVQMMSSKGHPAQMMSSCSSEPDSPREYLHVEQEEDEISRWGAGLLVDGQRGAGGSGRSRQLVAQLRRVLFRLLLQARYFERALPIGEDMLEQARARHSGLVEKLEDWRRLHKRKFVQDEAEVVLGKALAVEEDEATVDLAKMFGEMAMVYFELKNLPRAMQSQEEGVALNRERDARQEAAKVKATLEHPDM
ncbi:hypothetical protein T484DRAFT_1882569 [Baffinella frigidus]|nr:hypothetical protein T484DRAFT_1882569 [Cryptophyta sp. CCMP2293]